MSMIKRLPPALAATMTLDSCASDRNNNFNLIRFVLAAMVLVHHGFALTGSPIESSDLLSRGLTNLGFIGVGGFFLISGYLVTRSLLQRRSLRNFLLARVLRIYPGLWVMLIVTTSALAALSTLAPSDYFTHPATWAYGLRNATAMMITFPLPGVFQNNALEAVNGSLWSLKYEMLCYISLVIAGLIGVNRRLWLLPLVATACGAALAFLPADINYFLDLMRRLGFFFALGATAAAYASHVRLRLDWALGLLLIALVLDGTILRMVAWTIAFAYGLLWFAYVPKGRILGFNRLPDVSYGLYIYAFPIQQTLIATGIAATAFHNMAVAFPLTYVCAALSWYGIERPALKLKNRLGSRIDTRVTA